MIGLRLKMFLLVAILFGIIYAIVSMIAYSLGVESFYFYLLFSVFLIFIQYMIGPKIVEMVMRVKYVDKNEMPELHSMVEELASKAHIPTPKVGVAEIPIPNAFAFGRWRKDGRVCVTRGILRLLDKDELRAVLAHEITHLKNYDVLFITLLSVIPIVLYRIGWHLLVFGGRGNRREGGAPLALVGLAAFIFYFITNLLILYASRIREFFADAGAVKLGSRPHILASALYKLVYGSARTDKEAMREYEGLKAFFLNDPSRALNEIYELKELDLDRSGTIDEAELSTLSRKGVKVSFADKLMEILSTHPNMLKRIKQLSKYENASLL
ncbi:MAG: M48 family metalloprotease [Candidatus Stahlbacteria bacterium]|nr:M48 family metalloprotease [Candidatus Stahlbacteria bacterium]